jgi:hypothetical protein
MRRFVFAGGLFALAVGLALPGTTRAQTNPTPTPTSTPPLAPTAFTLTQASFPPPGHVFTSQVETNVQAAGEQRILHLSTKSFADENRVTGYFMDVGQANYDAKGATHPVFTTYLVSIYNSVDDATSAFTDQMNGWQTLLTDPSSPVTGKTTDLAGQQFGDQQPPGLYQATFSTSQGNADIYELLFRRGQYVIEVWQSELDSYATPFGAGAQPFVFSVARALDAVAAGTASTTPPAVQPVDFSLLTARVEPNHQEQDLAKPALTTTSAGSTVQLSVYLVVRNAGGNTKVKTDFKLTQGKRSAHRTHSFSLGATLPDYYGFTLYDVGLPRTGSYTFTGTVTIGKVTKRAAVTIKVSGGHRTISVRLLPSPAASWSARNAVSSSVLAHRSGLA